MAFTNQVIAIARESKLAVKVEVTPGTQIAANDSGLNLVLLMSAGQISQNLRRQDDIQYRNTRSRIKPIPESFEAGKWNFATWLHTKPGSGAPTLPDIDTFLHCGFGKSSGTDTTRFGSTPHVCYELLGVQAGGTVYPSFTAWFQEGHTARYMAGATVDQIDFEISGNEIVKFTFSGEFMRHGWCGTDVVVSASAGSIVVQDAKKYFIAQAGDTLYVQCVDAVTFAPVGSPLPVTAVNYNTNTLTVTGTPTAVAGNLVTPYINLPAEDVTYQPMVGKFGLVKIGAFVDNVFADLPTTTQVVKTAKISLKNGIKYHADMKDDQLYPTEYVVPSIREVTGEIGLFFYRNVLDYNYKNLSDPLLTDYLIIPAQDRLGSAGRLMQIHSQISYETPNISGEDEKTATIAFKGIATSAYNDELALVVYGS
jgi:hypothetical protein